MFFPQKVKEKTQKGGDGRQSETDGAEGVTGWWRGVSHGTIGAFEIYSVRSLGLNADIKIITAVC